MGVIFDFSSDMGEVYMKLTSEQMQRQAQMYGFSPPVQVKKGEHRTEPVYNKAEMRQIGKKYGFVSIN